MIGWRRYIIETDIVPNSEAILFHFDAAQNITISTGNNISEWGAIVSPTDNFASIYPDKTNARAIQTTAANQTVRVASDANFNGLPSVRNTSGSGFMTLQGQNPTTLVYTNTLGIFSLDMVCAFVGRIDTSTTHPSLFVSNLSNSTAGNLVYGGSSDTVRQRDGTKTSNNSGLALGDPFIAVFSDNNVIVNGVDLTGASWATNFTIANLSFSRLFGISQFGGATGAYRFRGRCAENIVWLWNGATITDLQSISTYLNNKFNIY